MTDYFGGRTRSDLEALLRHLVEQGAEGPKLDFKASLDLDSKTGQAELAKDISSIANTDDDGRLDDIGYIIVGAERGRLVGAALMRGDPDKLQARITDCLKNFVSPIPQFSVVAFEGEEAMRWGAIIIPPSGQQPHVLIRDGAAGLVKHEWHVRVNDTTERAAAHDYARMLAKATRREVRPIEVELQRLALRLEQQSAVGVDALTDALQKVVGMSASSETNEPRDLASRIRSRLVKDDAAVEDSLIGEALRVWEVMTGNSPENPWSFSDRSPEQLRSILSYLEEQSASLALALATIARYDQADRYTRAACRAIALIARQPEPTGRHHPNAGYFRLYPLVLCLYALVTIAAKEQRTGLLKQVFTLSFEDGDHIEPIVSAFHRVRTAHDIFNAALPSRYYEPVPVRVRDEFVPRLSSLLAGTAAQDAFRVAEFVISLVSLPVSPTIWGETAPMPGLYMYEFDARRTLQSFLRRRPDWVADAVSTPLPELLTAFDQNVAKVLQRAGRTNGFAGGARAAYDRL